MWQIVDGVCVAQGVSTEVQYKIVFPSVINSPAPLHAARQAATEVVGASVVDSDCGPKLFSEDFAHMVGDPTGVFCDDGQWNRRKERTAFALF